MKMKNDFVWPLFSIVVLVATPVFGVDKTWNYSGSGSATNPNYWTPYGVPGSADKAILPNQGFFYTVTSDAVWTINDLEIQRFATGWINGYGLTVAEGGDVWGTLWVDQTTYTAGSLLNLNSGSGFGGVLKLTNGTIANRSVNTSEYSQIIGYGTINVDLSNNNGLIRAEDGTLTIGLAANDHDAGTLSAATGATLYIRNTANVTNKATINVQGGTVSGYQYYTYNLINEDSGSQITGRGTIDHYYVSNLSGATIAPSGGTLTLAKGFASNQNGGNINLASGGTLNVGNADWTNYGTINMTGGALTGRQVSQNGTLNVTSGTTNAIQKIQFTGGATHSISSGANVNITENGIVAGATISGGGKLTVANNASVEGRGTIQPNVDVAGTLSANSSGNTLTVSGATTVLSGGVAQAVNGGTMSLSGNVQNRGQINASGGTVNATGTLVAATDATGDFSATSGSMNLSGATFQSNVRNTFTANSGGTITLPGGLSTGNLFNTTALRPRGGAITTPSGTTLTHGSGKLIQGYGYLMDSGRSLANRGSVDASGGTLELRGTVLADMANTGDFSATGGTLRVASSLQSGLYNTFTANSGGTVRFVGDLDTSLFSVDALKLRSGTITIEAANGTLTNAGDKMIEGYGQLLESGRRLANRGSVMASGGTLDLRGTILADAANTGDFSAVSGTLRVASTLETGLYNTFTAGSGGIVRFMGDLNTSLFAGDALYPRGGTITLETSGATLTNAADKTIAGFGQLLETGRALVNQGNVKSQAGQLTVAGAVTNSGQLEALSGSTLALTGSLANNGAIYTTGAGVVTVADTAPTGSGTFTANANGTIRFGNNFTNANLSTADALRLAGGTIALTGSGSMSNQAGKVIRGNGMLLESGQTLVNNSLLTAEGSLIVGGSVTNAGTIRATSVGDTVHIADMLTNYDLVDIGQGAQLGGKYITVTSTHARQGVVALQGASMTAHRLLSVSNQGYINDNGILSEITVMGDLSNRSQANTQFQLAHSQLTLRKPIMSDPEPNQLTWCAEDRGADVLGLNNNMAIGELIFGDGIGLPRSENFKILDQTTIYCYGIQLLQDAYVDLGGRTIYYLAEGIEHNGIVGKGFVNEGIYENGSIIEIIPEPATLAILGLGSLCLLSRRYCAAGKRRSTARKYTLRFAGL